MTLQTDGRTDGWTGYHNIPAFSSKSAGIKNSDNYQNLVYCNLKIISTVQSHGLTIHQVSTQSDENCRRSWTEISHI